MYLFNSTLCILILFVFLHINACHILLYLYSVVLYLSTFVYFISSKPADLTKSNQRPDSHVVINKHIKDSLFIVMQDNTLELR